MTTWKKYGGTNKLDNNNNITVNSIVTNSLTLKKPYYGTLDICGELHVYGNTTVDYNTTSQTLTVINDASVNGVLYMDKNSIHNKNVDIS